METACPAEARSVTQAGGAQQFLGPGGIFGGQRRIGGLAVVQPEVVAGAVVDRRQEFTDGQSRRRFVTAQRHLHFRNGVAHAEGVERGLGLLPAAPDQDSVIALRRWLFNFATVPFYWRNFAPEPGEAGYARPDGMLACLGKRGIKAKGHPLCWFHEMGCPTWMAGKSFGEWQDALRRFPGGTSRMPRRTTGRMGGCCVPTGSPKRPITGCEASPANGPAPDLPARGKPKWV